MLNTIRHHLVRHWPVVALLILGILGLALPALAAMAQEIPTVVTGPSNPNSPALVGYAVLASLLLGALLKALSPDNTTLPFAPSVNVLHAINVIGAVAVTCLTGIEGGTPWLQAIAVGAVPLVTGFSHVGHADAAHKALKAASAATPTPAVK
jgi:hypothetical protein